MATLEMGIYAEFWNDILERFNATSHNLQSPTMKLMTAVNSLKSVIGL